MDSSPVNRNTSLIAALVLAGAIFAAWHGTFSAPFVFDDASSIVANPTIRRFSWSALVPPNASITAQGRPILNLSLALNYAISGTAPWSYHALNLLIHFAAALALFGLVRRTLRTFDLQPATCHRAALASAALWAVHPLQTESVTYTIQRAESLMGLFFLLTFYCFVRATVCHPSRDRAGLPPSETPREQGNLSGYRPAGRSAGIWLGLSAACCFLGAATKEVTAVAPLLVLLYDRTFVAGKFSTALRARPVYYAALAATWLLLGWLVFGAGGNRGGSFGGDHPLWAYPLTQFEAVTRYLALSVWPEPLVFEYGTFWVERWTQVLPWVWPVLALLGFTCWALVRRPALGFLGAWFFAILAPTSLAPGTTQMIVEHRMYLPLAAVVVAVILLVQAWLRRRSWALFAGLAIVLALGTARRNEDYRSEVALWSDTVAKRPDNPLARQLLGMALEASGDRAGARVQYEAAVRLKPNFALAHDTLGQLLYRSGEKTVALEQFEVALALQPNFADAHDHLAVALAGQRRVAEAIVHHQAAVRLKPDFVEAHFNFANTLADAGRTAEAIVEYEVTVRLKPGYAAAQYNLANTLATSGRAADAVPHYEAAVRERPGYVEAWNNLGSALLDLGRTDEAIRTFERALQLDPNFAEARENLARIRAASAAH